MKKFFKTNDIYGVFAVYVIPIFTILLGSVLPWTSSNLSIIGNYYDRELALLLWGIIVAIYTYNFYKQIFVIADYKDRTTNIWVNATTICLVLAVVIPYLPDTAPFKSLLHQIFAFISPLMIGYILLRFLSYLSKKDESYKMFIKVAIGVTIFSFLILLNYMFVTSLLEIVVTCAVCFFSRALQIKVMEDYNR